MKRIVFLSVVCSVLLIGLFYSCATTETGTGGLYKPISVSENDTLEIIGSVQMNFTGNTSALDSKPTPANKEDAYIRLLSEAKKTYQRNDVDIRNISVVNQKSGWWKDVPLLANGDVVVRNNGTGGTKKNRSTTGIEGAINRASEALISDLSQNSSVAVLSISSKDRDTATFVIDELEYQLVDSHRFKVVDRKTLDAIRSEQKFQLSGDVDDNSAVSIGKMLGANIVITGSVTGTGSTQRLTIKALNVQTAQIVTIAREQF
jgi:TolB-like protein